MTQNIHLIPPQFIPPLEETFRPAALANADYRREASMSGSSFVIGLERGQGRLSRFETAVFPPGHPRAPENVEYVERLVKFLLWQRGGWKVYLGGDPHIATRIQAMYGPGGTRQFDADFMGRQVYEQPFTVVGCKVEDVPPTHEAGKPLGRNLNGCRIGFDLGASDRKVSAVIDGKVIYSEEVIWEPRKNSDPDYHYREIRAALLTAAEKMPRVDAIGGSSAGIYIDNRPMVASLFRAIPPEQFGKIHSIFLRLSQEFGVPLEVINDGDVTALAGSMSLEDNGVLGIAMGSSEAAGYVDLDGHIRDWLSELAFAPVDYQPEGPLDEWSGDRGCGSQYFSQQCVFRLAPRAGIELPGQVTDAEKLAYVQGLLKAGHEGAVKIWQSMGVYLGYGMAHYLDFYQVRHVLILGRCTSGSGGDLILEGARQVLRSEFPNLSERVNIQLPDEKSRRVGQSIAAASLPVVNH
jgi:predicted NBD/HSP70 family sugar kinase